MTFLCILFEAEGWWAFEYVTILDMKVLEQRINDVL